MRYVCGYECKCVPNAGLIWLMLTIPVSTYQTSESQDKRKQRGQKDGDMTQKKRANNRKKMSMTAEKGDPSSLGTCILHTELTNSPRCSLARVSSVPCVCLWAHRMCVWHVFLICWEICELLTASLGRISSSDIPQSSCLRGRKNSSALIKRSHKQTLPRSRLVPVTQINYPTYLRYSSRWRIYTCIYLCFLRRISCSGRDRIWTWHCRIDLMIPNDGKQMCLKKIGSLFLVQVLLLVPVIQ